MSELTSVDYKIVSVSDNSPFYNIENIRDKNNKSFQTREPTKEIKIEVSFKACEIAKIEFENNDSPQIEISLLFKENGTLIDKKQYLPKKTLFLASNKDNQIDRKKVYFFQIPDNELLRNKKFNGLELILSNPYHEITPTHLGINYLILLSRKEDLNLKTPTNLEKTPIESKFFSSGSIIKNSLFKQERYQKLQNPPQTEPKKSFLDKLISQAQSEKLSNFMPSHENERIQNTQKRELLNVNNYNKNTNNNNNNMNSRNRNTFSEKQLTLNFNSTKKNIAHQFDDDLQKAMEESKKTYEIEQIRYYNDFENFENGIEVFNETMEIEGKNEKNIFDNYKKMIYSDIQFKNEMIIDENSMFPLNEEDLDPIYLRLERNKGGLNN